MWAKQMLRIADTHYFCGIPRRRQCHGITEIYSIYLIHKVNLTTFVDAKKKQKI